MAAHLQTATSVAAVVATATVIIVHVGGELFSLRFVFVVLLAVHAKATIAGVDVGDALAAAAIAVTAEWQIKGQQAMLLQYSVPFGWVLHAAVEVIEKVGGIYLLLLLLLCCFDCE